MVKSEDPQKCLPGHMLTLNIVDPGSKRGDSV